MLASGSPGGPARRTAGKLLSTLDNLGVSHGESAQTVHTSISAATLGRNLIPALEVYAEILLKPHLDEEEIEPIRDLTLQTLQGLEDDPASKVMYELRSRHFPDPWGRPAPGTPEGVAASTVETIRSFHLDHYRPNGTIIAVAGAVDWPKLRDAVGRFLGDWPTRPEPSVSLRPSGPRRDHVLKETQQIQIALAYPTVPITAPDYYLARATAAILGGYASARLFTEVREKRASAIRSMPDTKASRIAPPSSPTPAPRRTGPRKPSM